MDFEIENTLGEYRSALKRYEQSVAFWGAIGSGQAVTVTSSELLLADWPPSTPDEACREAIAALDRSVNIPPPGGSSERSTTSTTGHCLPGPVSTLVP